ncbi:PAS domain S-box protein [Thiocapsa rosea]|uniref:PAS domain S-box protein n=1 Tax=Thiocapsa rosea TaxID=69360 RepID=UPI0014759B65|nr:PAS domain S-box protein [Thiocapsa rosea]
MPIRQAVMLLLIAASAGPFPAPAQAIDASRAPPRFLGNDSILPYIRVEDGQPSGLRVDLTRAPVQGVSLVEPAKEVLYVSREPGNRLILMGAGSIILLLVASTVIALAQVFKLRKANRLLAERERALVPIQALRESEARLQLGLRVAGLGLAEIDYATGTCHLTAKAAQLFGLGKDALSVTRETVHATFHPEDRGHLLALIAECLDPSGPGFFDLDHRVVLPGGRIRWLRVRKQVIFDDEEPARAMLAALDVTPEHAAADVLRDGERFKQAVLDAMPSEVAVLDRDGVIVSVNAPWRHFALKNGPRPGEPAPRTGIGTNYLEICATARGDSAEGANRTAAGIRAVMAGEADQFRVDYPCHSRDQQFWYTLTVSPLQRRDGSVVLVHTDISERKRSEQALRRSERRYRTLIEATSAVTWSCPPSGLQVEPQPDWMAFTGQSAEDMLGAGWTGAVHPQDRATAARGWTDAVRRGEPFANEQRIRRHDGEWRWMSVHAAPICDCDGQVVEWIGMNLDVTERKTAEEALKRERVLLQGIFDSIPVLLVLWDPRLKRFRLNRQAETVLGWSSAEANEGDFMVRVYPDPGYRAEVSVYMQSLRPSFHEWRCMTKGGEEVPIEWANVRLRDDTAIGIGVDLRPRKQAEAALRASETKYRTLFENMAEEVHFWQVVRDDSGAIETWRLIDVNPPALASWGRPTAEEIRGKTTDEIFGPGATAHHLPVVRQIMRDGVPHSFEDYFPHLDKYFRLTSVPLGEQFITTGADITAIKRAERALLHSREGLSRLAEASLAVMAKTDLGAMLEAIAEAALTLTGARLAICGYGLGEAHILVERAARSADAPACPPGVMFRPDPGGVHLSLLEGAVSLRLSDRELHAHPRWQELPQGHAPLRGLLGVPLSARNGAPSGVILVTDKVQGNFEAEDEALLGQLATVASLALQHVEARLALEEADRRKDRFIAMLGHELRNPLAPIRNSLAILELTPPGGELCRQAQSMIDRQVRHLTRLVDDLLDITRIARGKITLQREPLELCALLRCAVDDYRDVLAESRIALELRLPEEALWMSADRTRLVQVIGNLLSNAGKFTPPGGRIQVSLAQDRALGQAILKVCDTGIGIAPEMLPRVFEPFVQADTTLERSRGGLGLGLATVKGLIEMHGGRVQVASAGLGSGTELTLQLPLEGAARPAETSTERRAPNGARRHILVIEDNPDAAESLRLLLALAGHRVELACSGPEGLEKARALGPDLILCDIGLPGMDGYAVARTLRLDPTRRAATLVALSGYAAPEDVAKAVAAGFDAHLAKPLSLEKLEALLGDDTRGGGVS